MNKKITRRKKTYYMLIKWLEEWAIYDDGLAIERKADLEHLQSNWKIQVLCDDQPLPMLVKMRDLARGINHEENTDT